MYKIFNPETQFTNIKFEAVLLCKREKEKLIKLCKEYLTLDVILFKIMCRVNTT